MGGLAGVSLNLSSKLHRVALAVTCCVLALALAWCTTLVSRTGTSAADGTRNAAGHTVDLAQYDRLADALLHGSLSLDLPVDPGLAALPNPYDASARTALCSQGATIYWDHAFYQGKYYCYFGVVPALALFVPYELATGSWLDTGVACAVLAVALVVSATLLASRLVARYFGDGKGQGRGDGAEGSRGATLGQTIIVTIALVAGSNATYGCYYANFYAVPYLSALALAFLGLWFWLGARRDGAGGSAGGGAGGSAGGTTRLSRGRLAAGSLCMALTMGCRPQFVLACLLAVPIFWQEIVRERTLFSRRGLAATACALLPALVVAAGLLWYNAARFGSPLSFGNAYNLTGFDATSLRMSAAQVVPTVVLYLVQPLVLVGTFPFVEASWSTLLPIPGVPHDPTAGGIFALAPFGLFALAVPTRRRDLRARGLWGFCLVLLGLGVLILVADAYLAGFGWTYETDFGWLVTLAAAIAYLSIVAGGGRGAKVAGRLAVVAVVWAVVVQALLLFATGRYDPLVSSNPVLFSLVAGVFGRVA